MHAIEIMKGEKAIISSMHKPIHLSLMKPIDFHPEIPSNDPCKTIGEWKSLLYSRRMDGRGGRTIPHALGHGTMDIWLLVESLAITEECQESRLKSQESRLKGGSQIVHFASYDDQSMMILPKVNNGKCRADALLLVMLFRSNHLSTDSRGKDSSEGTISQSKEKMQSSNR